MMTTDRKPLTTRDVLDAMLSHAEAEARDAQATLDRATIREITPAAIKLSYATGYRDAIRNALRAIDR